ncbi:hypothetical protein M2459_000067 [Parabacteroides sp. PF5-5]|uniref:hypothetical protein n=1 Tax=unclassified Parabacteroides TaxID=2649774 RepID=UPI002477168B|nr:MULTISPECIES: hypothetical protein [unclassified Parabacteroides]MDH6303735.1 hypothetical protein [Parabacteroides sp. PH5-39]MDH6314352.1 hypothetical protein [Parabacteroides sp. PF5-13]MDH6318583.1 hypothetical protein [Parabacteroides sp. PH5-13]MDH6322124.1 hypothetical protein [Parabacteroides sp. PH5-8]MDH6325796.1 hypothetical protein [Parabacteroides sp. PH5-41]
MSKLVNEENKEKISRKTFLQICASVAAGGSLTGLSAVLLHKRSRLSRGDTSNVQKNTFVSPYKRLLSFSVPDQIEAFELAGDNLLVAMPNNLSIYDRTGRLLNNFAIGSELRDIVVDHEAIYLLFPTRIEVYTKDGELLRDWEACSELSDYCSMVIASGSLFVTDAANKNICKYTTEGNFVRFIQSPDGFIIPSYSFGITYVNGIIYCSNSGRHKVEKYSTDGEYLGSFGKAGGAIGMFCGCCNPVHLSATSTGEIVTSEKGNPRISCYGSNGEFRSMLLDSKALGGGNTAYDIKVDNDKLFVAGKNQISTFQYDKTLAAKTACSDCKANCPLREGINI